MWLSTPSLISPSRKRRCLAGTLSSFFTETQRWLAQTFAVHRTPAAFSTGCSSTYLHASEKTRLEFFQNQTKGLKGLDASFAKMSSGIYVFTPCPFVCVLPSLFVRVSGME